MAKIKNSIDWTPIILIGGIAAAAWYFLRKPIEDIGKAAGEPIFSPDFAGIPKDPNTGNYILPSGKQVRFPNWWETLFPVAGLKYTADTWGKLLEPPKNFNMMDWFGNIIPRAKAKPLKPPYETRLSPTQQAINALGSEVTQRYVNRSKQGKKQFRTYISEAKLKPQPLQTTPQAVASVTEILTGKTPTPKEAQKTVIKEAKKAIQGKLNPRLKGLIGL